MFGFAHCAGHDLCALTVLEKLRHLRKPERVLRSGSLWRYFYARFV